MAQRRKYRFNWLDIRNIIDPEFERYDDIEYKGWDSNGDLL